MWIGRAFIPFSGASFRMVTGTGLFANLKH